MYTSNFQNKCRALFGYILADYHRSKDRSDNCFFSTRPSITQGFMRAQGKVITPVGPCTMGQISLQGVFWKAKSIKDVSTPLSAGTLVEVVERIGLVLLIRPIVLFSNKSTLPLLNACEENF